MLKRLTLFLFTLTLSFTVKGQSEVAIYYTPTSVISGDFTLNFELGVPQLPNSRFMISPKLRLGTLNLRGDYSVVNPDFNEVSSTEGDEITRTGLELMHRIFLVPEEQQKKQVMSHTYFSYGLGYNFTYLAFDVSQKQGFSSGATSLEEKNYATIINTADLFCQVGKRFDSRESFVFDLFFGVRYRKSFSTTNSPVTLRNYERGFLAPKYSGVMPTLGFRLGIFLNKFSEE